MLIFWKYVDQHVKKYVESSCLHICKRKENMYTTLPVFCRLHAATVHLLCNQRSLCINLELNSIMIRDFSEALLHPSPPMSFKLKKTDNLTSILMCVSYSRCNVQRIHPHISDASIKGWFPGGARSRLEVEQSGWQPTWARHSRQL